MLRATDASSSPPLTCSRHPFQRFPHRGPGHAENLGEAPLAGQRLAGLHIAAEYLTDDLLEDVLGNRSPVHRL
jgi:hypothetical protein